MRSGHGLHVRPALRKWDARDYLGRMDTARPLAEALAAAQDAAGEWTPVYDDFVEGLRGHGVGKNAPRVGEPFPAFSLPDAVGQYRSLDGLVADGPVVLSFNRGGWCPYCTHELRAWNELLPDLSAAGAQFAAITPEVGGRAALMSRLLDGDAELLCDVDHGLALAAGLAFYVGAPLLRQYREWGLDLASIYGNDSGFLPVPATFVVDREGIVTYAFVDPDFRIRAEPADVLDAVRSLG